MLYLWLRQSLSDQKVRDLKHVRWGQTISLHDRFAIIGGARTLAASHSVQRKMRVKTVAVTTKRNLDNRNI